MQRRDWTQKAWIIFIVGVITFVPDIGHAKADDDQSNIVLLNDAASALEDSSPDLSKRLTQFADHKEKEWEAKNANKDAPATPVTGKETSQLQDEVKLLKAAAVAIRPTYPLIAKSLKSMAKDIERSIEIEK